jgi:hypothetical protein
MLWKVYDCFGSDLLLRKLRKINGWYVIHWLPWKAIEKENALVTIDVTGCYRKFIVGLEHTSCKNGCKLRKVKCSYGSHWLLVKVNACMEITECYWKSMVVFEIITGC